VDGCRVELLVVPRQGEVIEMVAGSRPEVVAEAVAVVAVVAEWAQYRSVGIAAVSRPEVVAALG